MSIKKRLRLLFFLVLIFFNLTVTPFLITKKITLHNEEVYSTSVFSKEDAMTVREEMLQYFKERYPNDIIKSGTSNTDYPYIGYALDENGILRGYIVVWIYRTYAYCVLDILAIPWVMVLNIIILEIIANPIDIFCSSIPTTFRKSATSAKGILCTLVNRHVGIEERK